MPPVVPYRALRLCSSGGAYEAIPERNLSLDLARIRRVLEGRGIPVVDARVLLIAQLEPEVTVSRSGRVLIKTKDPAEARRSFDLLRGLVQLPAAPEEQGAPQPS